MNILTLNVGSTNVKYSIFKDSEFVVSGKTEDVLVLIKDKNIDVVINRIVFGGEGDDIVLVNSESIKLIKSKNRFAPLHNPPAIAVIESIIAKFKDIKQYMVFDTTYHKTIPDYRRNYALPLVLINELGIYRYGFHGLSHAYLASAVPTSQKVITLHLGGGASVCAIESGKSVACSMGFGPEEGLFMVSRTGDIGASVILDIMESKGLSVAQTRDLIFKQSGLLGLTGTKEVKDIMTVDKPEYNLAREMFVNKIVDMIGSYYLLLGGLDTLIFSGGIGENSDILRKLVILKLEVIGAKLDQKANTLNQKIISTSSSKFEILVIEAREDLSMIKLIDTQVNS